MCLKWSVHANCLDVARARRVDGVSNTSPSASRETEKTRSTSVNRCERMMKSFRSVKSSEQPQDWSTMLHESAWSVQCVAVLGGQIDAQGMVDGGDQVVRVDGRVLGIGTVAVGLA